MLAAEVIHVEAT